MKYPKRLRPSAPQVPALEPTVVDAYDGPQELSSNKVATSILNFHWRKTPVIIGKENNQAKNMETTAIETKRTEQMFHFQGAVESDEATT